MNFLNKNATLLVPDNIDEQAALSRTTALCVAAHQDDIEIMAYNAIADCYGRADKWFGAVTVTDGAGSPRTGVYENCTDDDMKKIRAMEQDNAARVGGYSAMMQLCHPSSKVKAQEEAPVAEIAEIIKKCAPSVIYTHNIADKHPTHVAVSLLVIKAVCSLPKELRPQKLYGMEVWRGLDWLCPQDKVIFDAAERPGLAAALLGVFDSQVSGGKRYDLASIGRRVANATYSESHATDEHDAACFGMDMTELMGGVDVAEFVKARLDRFQQDVLNGLNQFGGK